MTGWQNDFWGNSHRNTSWKDIIRRLILRVGDRPDLEAEEYNRKITGLLIARELPATEQMIKAIIKKRNVDYGLNLMEKFFQSPDKVPAADTIARAARHAKSGLEGEGRLPQIGPEAELLDDLPSWQSMLAEAEEEDGYFHSGIEARFKVALNERFPQYRWEENKKLPIQTGPYEGYNIVPDFVCEKLCLSIEIDSYEFHNNRESFIDDRKRARIMQHLGYTHFQFSGPELAVPHGMRIAIQEIEYYVNNGAQRQKAA